MAKGMLSGVNESIQRQVRNKIRKSLQTLQVSADEQSLTGNNMVPSDDKIAVKGKQSKTLVKVTTEKENVCTLRRSKRKAATSGEVTNVEFPDECKAAKSSTRNATKSKKTASKSKKGHSAVINKDDQSVTLNQTKLNFPTVTETIVGKYLDIPSADTADKNASTSTEAVTEDSGFDPNCGVSDQSPMNSTTILHLARGKYDEEISMMTGDNPPLSYWKSLAEQRRLALEKALHENELLHDQLTVLEAENSQLKQLVREAENLAQIVRGIVE